jgi:hypothetical protein
MIIKATDKIVIPGASIIEINKIRMKNIQNNIYDLSLVDKLFSSLEKAILKRDIAELEKIIGEQLFFEVPCNNLGSKMIDVYDEHVNKKYFIDELKKSYMIRGVKGIQFTWMPILNRRG